MLIYAIGAAITFFFGNLLYVLAQAYLGNKAGIRVAAQSASKAPAG